MPKKNLAVIINLWWCPEKRMIRLAFMSSIFPIRGQKKDGATLVLLIELVFSIHLNPIFFIEIPNS
ncbi:MAG: hypothetical protein WD267_13980 [Balneolales bacterium]